MLTKSQAIINLLSPLNCWCGRPDSDSAEVLVVSTPRMELIRQRSSTLGAAYRRYPAVIDRLDSCVVSSQLCKGLSLMRGAIPSDRHASIRI